MKDKEFRMSAKTLILPLVSYTFVLCIRMPEQTSWRKE